MIYFLQEDRGSKYSAAVYADNECRADEDRSRLALDFLRYFPSRIIQSNWLLLLLEVICLPQPTHLEATSLQKKGW